VLHFKCSLDFIGDRVAARCMATTKAGEACPVAPVTGKTLCASHDPETRAIAQKKGGEATFRKARYLSDVEARTKINLRDRKDVPATIEAIARSVATGSLETRVGNALVIACNVTVSAIDSIEKAVRGRLGAMTDEELRAALEQEFAEWQARAATK